MITSADAKLKQHCDLTLQIAGVSQLQCRCNFSKIVRYVFLRDPANFASSVKHVQKPCNNSRKQNCTETAYI